MATTWQLEFAIFNKHATICHVFLTSGNRFSVRRVPVEKIVLGNGDSVEMKGRSLSTKDLSEFRQSYFEKVNGQVEKIREDNKRAYEDARRVVLS